MTYDALERMVEQDKSGSYSQIVYDPSGDKLGLMSNTSTITRAFAPLPGGAKAEYNASGLFVYAHADWLGSWRLFSTPTRSLYMEQYYAPFGEQYPSTSSVPWASFAGMNAETDAYVYDASFREYAIQGRWPSPDPAGISAADPTNPQSWNRYAYVLNNPLLLTDAMGFCPDTVQNQPNGNGQQATPASGPSIFGPDGEMELPPQQMGSYGCGWMTAENPNNLDGGGDDSGMLGMGLVSFSPGMSDNGNDIASAFGLMQIPVYGLQADWGQTGYAVSRIPNLPADTNCTETPCYQATAVYGVTGIGQVQIGTAVDLSGGENWAGIPQNPMPQNPTGPGTSNGSQAPQKPRPPTPQQQKQQVCSAAARASHVAAVGGDIAAVVAAGAGASLLFSGGTDSPVALPVAFISVNVGIGLKMFQYANTFVANKFLGCNNEY